MPKDIIAEVAKQAKIDLPGVSPGIGEVEPDGTPEESADDADGEAPDDAGASDAAAEPEGDGESAEGSESGAEEAPAQDTASRLAAIAEAEDEIRVAQGRLKKKQAEFEALQGQLAEQQKQNESLAASFKSDPFGVLEQLGVPFDHLLQIVHDNKGEIPKASRSVKKNEDEMPAWAKKLSESIERIENERVTAVQSYQVEQGRKMYREQIQGELKKPSYAILRTMKGAEDTIMSIAEAHAAQTGELLSVERIAASLQEEWHAQLKELPNYDAIAATLKAPPPGKAPKAESKKPGRQSGEAEEEPEQTSLSSDMPPSKGAKKKPKSKSEVIRAAAKSLDSQLWGTIEEEDEE